MTKELTLGIYYLAKLGYSQLFANSAAANKDEIGIRDAEIMRLQSISGLKELGDDIKTTLEDLAAFEVETFGPDPDQEAEPTA